MSLGMIGAVVIGLGHGALAAQSTTDEEQQRQMEAMFPKGPQEEDVYLAQKLLVTATGSLKPVRLAPSVASVVTAEEIRAMGATSLDEVLETVPGLHVTPSGGNFFSSIWSIRGIHTSVNPEALMLLNGVPLTSNYQGSRPQLFRMPVEMISRVEVVRGPGSALHGADAFSGVINVITKDNFEIAGTQAGARVGSFDGYDGWLQHGGQYHGWDLALGMAWQKSTGDDHRIVEQDRLTLAGSPLSNAPGPLDTKFNNLDGNLQLRRGDWDLHLYGSLQEAGAGPGGLQALTYGSDADSTILLTDLAYRNDHSIKNWELGGRLYYSYINQDALIQFLPKGYSLFPGPNTFTQTPMQGEPIQTSQDGGVETFAVYNGLSDHRLRLGAGCKNNEFEPDQYKNFPPTLSPTGEMVHITDPALRYIKNANRQLWYGLIQDEWHLARRWELTAGVRYDDYSDFGSTTNPRAALVWETLPELTTKLLYGQAFRAPSFSEQYITKNLSVQSNPDLTPGEIETLELAFDYQPTARLRTALNLFSTNTDGMVHLVPQVPPNPPIYQNYDNLRSHGFEVELEWQPLEQLKIKSNFAYQRSKNTKIDAMVADAPEMQCYLNPHWTFLPEWSVDGQYYWIGDRHREKADSQGTTPAYADPRDDVDAYQVVNLTLRRENIAKHWEAAVAVRNLFDEDGREPSPYTSAAGPLGAFIPDDYPIATRSVWAELRFHY
jgi:iron complex outermembrane receptor protein